MSDDEFDAVAGHLVGDRDALFGIGGVVAVKNLDFLAHHAAGRVDVGGGLVDAVFHLRAGRGARPSDRSGDAELDLGRGSSRKGKYKAQREAERGDPFHREVPLN